MLALTRDHVPDSPTETARITLAEGYVYRGRVNGALAVSRALGDTSYKAQPHLPPEKQLVSSQPGVTTHRRSEADSPEIAKMRTEASADVAQLWHTLPIPF